MAAFYTLYTESTLKAIRLKKLSSAKLAPRAKHALYVNLHQVDGSWCVTMPRRRVRSKAMV